MAKDLREKKFGRLQPLFLAGYRKDGCLVWICRCDCGGFHPVPSRELLSKKIKSCGCLRKKWYNGGLKDINKKHLHSVGKPSKTYSTWRCMRQRCYRPKRTNFKYYGGRGIFVCRRWRNSFENFLKDMGERPVGKSLDRINNNGPYGPWNCRWATQKEQINNRRI